MARVEEIRYRAHKPIPCQAKYLQNCANPQYVRNFFVGGFGCGKTHIETQMLTELTVGVPGNKVAVVRKWRKDIEDTIYTEFLNNVEPSLILQEKRSDLRITMRSILPQYPSTIEFRGMDDRGRWGSTFFGHIIADEASELDELEFFTLEGRLRHKFKPEIIQHLLETNNTTYLEEYEEKGEYRWDAHRFVCAVSNPTDELHWMFRTCVSEKAVGTSLVQASTYENYENLPHGYRQIIDNYPESLKFTKVLGNWGVDIAGTPVTPSFSLERHYIQFEIPRDPIKIYRGIDFGYTRPAVGWWWVNEGKIYKVAELLGDRWHLERLMTHVKEIEDRRFHKSCEYETWVDHSAGIQHSMSGDKPPIEKLKDMGYRIKSRPTKPGDRIDLIENLFFKDKAYIHKSLELSKNAYSGGWCRDQKNPDEPDKSPGNPYHNLADADGYALMGAFGPVARERIRPRMQPQRRAGYQNLGIGVMYNGQEKSY